MAKQQFYVPNEIYDVNISPSAKLVYQYFCRRANKEGKSYPEHATIAADTGYSVSTVKRAIKELQAAKMITVVGRIIGGKVTSNEYIVHPPETWLPSIWRDKPDQRKTADHSQVNMNYGQADSARSQRTTKDSIDIKHSFKDKNIEPVVVADTFNETINAIKTLLNQCGVQNTDYWIALWRRKGNTYETILAAIMEASMKSDIEDLAKYITGMLVKNTFIPSKKRNNNTFSHTYSGSFEVFNRQTSQSHKDKYAVFYEYYGDQVAGQYK